MMKIYVSNPDAANHENGDFCTISAANASISKENNTPVTILVRKGIYHEKLVFDRPFVTLEGEDAKETIITYGDYALMLMEDNSKRGTFRTATVMVNASDFTAQNITFQNSAGFGSKVGQALALYAEYNNYGAGYIPEKRTSFARILSEKEARQFTKEKVLAGEDGWNPVI